MQTLFDTPFFPPVGEGVHPQEESCCKKKNVLKQKKQTNKKHMVFRRQKRN